MSYQQKTGTLNPGGHPGSYNGQDAYNDMLITTARRKSMDVLERNTDGKHIDSEPCGGGQRMPDKDNFMGVVEPVALSDRKGNNGVSEDGTALTLTAQEKERPVVATMAVRRLTPLECERLQGFDDGWTDIGEWTDTKGKKHKEADSPRYKALGNSIALPFWQWLARRIMAQYEQKDVTMASLFDGISGFCVVFSRAGCKPVWSSEIEEFAIAVAKKHFGEE